MEQIQHSFKRYEKKFLLTREKYDKLIPDLKKKMHADEYGMHTICNIYFDTEKFDLIRASIERPAYKEKFRLRSYGTARDDDIIFAEIKKKFDGVVYKRRVEAHPEEILDFIRTGAPIDDDAQIQREIQWFLKSNQPKPKVFIGYERVAYVSDECGELRVTFDNNIRQRTERLDLRHGDDGELITPDNKIVMEVKTPSSIPLWLAELLSAEEIFPASFSKYGTCYQNQLLNEMFSREEILC